MFKFLKKRISKKTGQEEINIRKQLLNPEVYFGNDDVVNLDIANKFATHCEKLAPKYLKMTNEQLQSCARKFYDSIELENNWLKRSDLLEAFAISREASYRIMKERPFFVQVMGAFVLYDGDIAEMKTGEGKTLTAIMAIFASLCARKQVVVVTVNEYLAKRDATTYGKIIEFLGFNVGINLANMNHAKKQEVYKSNVIYSTHAELGFDYLRDNLVHNYQDKVQTKLDYAIIDECDSVLVDEAKTPLIISSQAKPEDAAYVEVDKFVKTLKPDDVNIDWEGKNASLTLSGQNKANSHFKIDSIFKIENTSLYHRLQNALYAEKLLEKGKEYLVSNGEIKLIDNFTGRVMEGRKFSSGLHQAIEAKEGVKLSDESKTSATITYQNFFRLFKKIAGMTGTAKTEEKEFLDIYNMRVVPVPTNKKMIRTDYPDMVYASSGAKYRAIMNKISEAHENKRPILVGTISIESSRKISKLLTEKGINHRMLNASQNETEADVISTAGQLNSVVIATNMAGRGTDIKLGPGVVDVKGLLVIGTERHESRRIDNQLRGRCGRQGDPGESIFFLSLDDELMKRFGVSKLKFLYKMMGDDPVISKRVTKTIEKAQRRIEGMNFDQRKHLLQYDNVLNQQRELVYSQRDNILKNEHVDDLINIFTNSFVERFVDKNTKVNAEGNAFFDLSFLENIEKTAKESKTAVVKFWNMKELQKEVFNISFCKKTLLNEIREQIQAKRQMFPEEVFFQITRRLLLDIVSNLWTFHLEMMMKLRSGIYLRSYSQKNPLQEYTEEATELFELMKFRVSEGIVLNLLKMGVGSKPQEPQPFIPFAQSPKTIIGG